MVNMMKWTAGLMVLLMVVGCTPKPPNISGAYIARGAGFVELLQLTESPDGQLLGSLQHFGLQTTGTTDQVAMNVSGSSDGKSVTLVIKRNEPFAVATNISGNVDGGSITLNQATGAERFVNSTADAYQADVSQLSASGQAIQQNNARAQQTADQNKRVMDLTAALDAWAAKIEANHHWLPGMHAGQAKILDTARKDLDMENRLKAGNSMQQAQASMVQARISQLFFELSSFNIPLTEGVQTGHAHVQQYDQAIAASPCKTNVRPHPIACTDEGPAEQRYQAARTIVLQELDEADAAVKRSSADMEAINKQAGN